MQRPGLQSKGVCSLAPFVPFRSERSATIHGSFDCTLSWEGTAHLSTICCGPLTYITGSLLKLELCKLLQSFGRPMYLKDGQAQPASLWTQVLVASGLVAVIPVSPVVVAAAVVMVVVVVVAAVPAPVVTPVDTLVE